MKAQSQAGLAPSPASFSASSPDGNFTIPATNYWTQRIFGAARAADITSWTYRFVDFGPRLTDTTFEDFALTNGFKGEVSERISWDVSYLWNRNNENVVERNGVNRARLLEVLQGRNATYSGAKSFNPFVNPFDTGVIANDPDMLNYIKLEPRTERVYTTSVINATLALKPFDLPAGTVEILGGWEKRKEDFVRTPDLAKQQAAGSGWNSTSAEATSYSVKSIFAEGIVPVIADAPFTKKLQIGAAIRNETFSHLKKDATVGRLYVRDQFTKELTGRLSYSEGYTAPTVLNLTEKPAQNFPQIFMPWLGVAEQPYLGTLEGGNPNLKPTSSESLNLGLVWSPKAVKGLTISVDVYKIKRSDIIIRDAQLYVDVFSKAGGLTKLANGNYSKNASAPYADRINIDLDGSRTGTKGSIIEISPVPYENVASLDAKGVDLETTYSLPTRDWGNFTWRLNLTRVQSYDMVKLPGLPATKFAGYFTPNDAIGPVTVPQWRGNFDTAWAWKNLDALVKLNYTHSYAEDPDGGDNFTGKVASWPTWDLTVGYKFQKYGNTSVRFGLENVFNRMPPKAESSFADKYDRSMHNILGRMYTIKLNQRF
jgi:iron complex outermembrane receptor protein